MNQVGRTGPYAGTRALLMPERIRAATGQALSAPSDQWISHNSEEMQPSEEFHGFSEPSKESRISGAIDSSCKSTPTFETHGTKLHLLSVDSNMKNIEHPKLAIFFHRTCLACLCDES